MSIDTAVVERGCYGNKDVQRLYLSALAHVSDGTMSAGDEILQAHYMYRCMRKIRILRLAEAHGLHGITDLLGYAARTLFNLTARQNGGFGRHPSRATASAWVSHDYLDSAGSEGFLLGSKGHAELRSRTLLGSSASEATSVLVIEVVIRVAEWFALVNRSAALINFMAVCDLCVPLNMNYRIHFTADPEDLSFRLEFGSNVSAEDDRRAVLGVNSALGCA